MQVKSVTLSDLGYAIPADLYVGGGKKVIMVVIGGGSSKANQKELVGALVKQTDYDAFVFDLAGHGESKLDINNIRPAQHFLECIEVFDWLSTKYGPENIAVMGSSYGGFLAALLALHRQFPKLVLRVPASYQPDNFYNGRSIVQDTPEKFAYRRNYEAVIHNPMFERAKSFEGKTLVVVHENDTSCPKPTTDAFVKAFGAEEFFVKDFPHSLSELTDNSFLPTYQKTIADWIKNN